MSCFVGDFRVTLMLVAIFLAAIPAGACITFALSPTGTSRWRGGRA